MRALITGVAGFIGSHLAEAVLGQGGEVVGVDSFTPYYDRRQKQAHLAAVRGHPRFRLVEGSLLELDLDPLVQGVDVVFHLAAQPGVRPSWGAGFEAYVQHNVLATQRLLEAAARARLHRLVYASSSSVYGPAVPLPATEEGPCRPLSPYGVTKLAAEHLCHAYRQSHGVPAVILRYFTVYGPRQRPDMAFHRFCLAILRGKEIVLYGTGDQSRDFTYVADVVAATLAAAAAPPGTVCNVAGGARVSLRAAVDLLAELAGRPARVRQAAPAAGDVPDTWADLSASQRVLGYQPRVGLREGLAAELDWIRRYYGL